MWYVRFKEWLPRGAYIVNSLGTNIHCLFNSCVKESRVAFKNLTSPLSLFQAYYSPIRSIMSRIMALRIASAIGRCAQPSVSLRVNGHRPSRLSVPTLRPGTHILVRSAGTDGQINTDLIDRMRGKIQDALQAQSVEVADVQGDGRHVEIVVVAESFEGQSAVNRQRMVYKAIWEELSETVHAVDAMVTKTPKEAGL